VATKAEKEHYAKLAELGCIACHVLGYGCSPCEIHHIRTGTGMAQKSHWSKAVGLCHNHHRNGGHGVAIHAGIEAFEKTIGMTEVELLAKNLVLLN